MIYTDIQFNFTFIVTCSRHFMTLITVILLNFQGIFFFFWAAVAEWLSSWLAEQEDRGSIPRLATWIFRDWLSPVSKSRYGWKIAKSTLIKKQPTNQPSRDFCTLMHINCHRPRPVTNLLHHLSLSAEKVATLDHWNESNASRGYIVVLAFQISWFFFFFFLFEGSNDDVEC